MAVQSQHCEFCLSSDNLKLFDNGSSFCFTPDCEYNKQKKTIVDDTPRELVQGEYKTITNRRISQRTCEFFGYQVGEDKGKTCHIANYRDKTGKIIGQKLRFADKQFECRGNMKSPSLFGKHLWSNNSKTIIICEGEIDCLSIAEAQDCKWPVVSVPTGAQSAAKVVKQELEWLSGFQSIIFCFDNDEAGKSGLEDCIGLFAPGKVKIASLSEKDANECLIKGKIAELTKIVWNANEYRPDGIIWGSEIDWVEIRKPKPRGLSLPYPILDEMIRGLKPGRIYTVYAGCVDGDTEFLTRTGWKKISDYNNEDVGEYVNGSLVFTQPEKYWELPAHKFYHLTSTRGVDMMLSPEHTVYYKYNGRTKPQTISMEDLYNAHNVKPNGFQGKFFTTFNYDGPGIDFTEGELRLQVAVNADGRIVKEGKDNYTQMRFNKKRKYDRLKDLCIKYGLRFNDRGFNNQEQYEIIVWPKSGVKRYTDNFYSASEEQLHIIFDEMRYWDGTTIHGLRYFSKYKQDIDFIQFAGAACGMRGNVYEDSKQIYELSFTKQTMVGVGGKNSKDNIKVLHTTNKFKYCFTMPNKTWIARRNNKIFVTHNTGLGKSTCLRELGLHIAKAESKKTSVIANIFLEENYGFTAESYIAMNANIPEYKLEENPELLSNTLFEEGKAIVSNMGFYNHFGSLDSKRLFNLFDYLVVAKGVNIIMLDHISLLMSGMRSESGEGERRDIDLLMTNLRSFSERTRTTIVAATQLKRKKGSYSEGEEITEADSRGSGAIEHISDVIFSLNVDTQSNNPNDAQIKVIKNRITGQKGNADLITYNSKTGRYLPKKVNLGSSKINDLLDD